MNLKSFIIKKLKKEGNEIYHITKESVFFYENNYKTYLYELKLKDLKNINDLSALKNKNLINISNKKTLIDYYINSKRTYFFYELDKTNNKTVLNFLYKKKILKRELKGIYFSISQKDFFLTRDSKYTYHYTASDIMLGTEPKKTPYQFNIENSNLTGSNSVVIDGVKYYYDEFYNLILKCDLINKKIIFDENKEYQIPEKFYFYKIDISYLNGNYYLKNNYFDIYLFNNAKTIIRVTYNKDTKEIEVGKCLGVPDGLSDRCLYGKNNKIFNFSNDEKINNIRRSNLFKNRLVEFSYRILNHCVNKTTLSSSVKLNLLTNNKVFVNNCLIQTNNENIKLLKFIFNSLRGVGNMVYMENLGIYILTFKEKLFLFNTKLELLNFKLDKDLVEYIENIHQDKEENNKELYLLKYELTEEEIKRIKLLIKTGA